MKLVGLCPTFGRRRSLLEGTLKNFVHQDHPDKQLLIFDDSGILEHTRCDVPGVRIMATNVRQSSVGAKYNTMIQWLHDNDIAYDGVLVIDDDDLYAKDHWSAHAKILATHGWSKPSRIISAYHRPPMEEDASGRFHGSIAVRKDLLEKAPWIDTKLAVFDQMYMQRLASFEPPGDPCTLGPPTYTYVWHNSSGHCSGLMGDPEWYAKYRPDSTEPIDRLWAEFDADSIRIAKHCGVALP